MRHLMIIFYFPFFPQTSTPRYLLAHMPTVQSNYLQFLEQQSAAIYRSDILHLTLWTKWKKGIHTVSTENSTISDDISNNGTKDGSHHEKIWYVKGKKKSVRIWMEKSHCFRAELGHISFKQALWQNHWITVGPLVSQVSIPPPCSAFLLNYLSPCPQALPLPHFSHLFPVGDHHLVH